MKLLIIASLTLLAGSMHAEILYTGGANNIYAFQVQANGSLTQIADSPFPSGNFPASIVVFGKFLYESNPNDGTIWTYRIGPGGALTPLAVSKAGVEPYGLAIDPSGRFLYVSNIDRDPTFLVDHVSVYKIGANGALAIVGSPSPAGMNAFCIVADPFGRFVYAGNEGGPQYDTETVSGYQMTFNGLVPLAGSPFADDEGPQSMAIDPFGRFVYAAGQYDLGLVTHRIAENGTLTIVSDNYGDGNADGYQLLNCVAVDPLGRFVFQFSAPEGATSGKLLVYRVGATGITLKASYQSTHFSNTMIVNHSGQFLYIENSVYRIASDGTLTLINGLHFTGGGVAMAVSPY
jgi:6-phosphogluconolactonase